MSNKGFSETQKLYLEGLASGLRAQLKVGVAVSAVGRRGLLAEGSLAEGSLAEGSLAQGAQRGGLEGARRAAQERLSQEGQRPCAEDRAKAELDPDEMWGRMLRLSKAGEFPRGDDAFRYKFHGLFHTAPTEDAFMCRLRFPAGLVSSYQLRSIVDMVGRYAQPQLQLTMRSNLQLRGIAACHASDLLIGLREIGVLNQGAGADGVRNVLASPTAGFDRQELIDTSLLARESHHYLLASRHVHALPRKFLVAFDGGGAVGAAPESSDLGFRAVVVGEHDAVAPGVYFRVLLGGAPSHARLGRDSGVVVSPAQCLSVVEAVLAIYMEHGDRTNRRRARFVYLLESWGMERFLEELQARLEFELPRVPSDRCATSAPRPFAHIGFHNQKPRGLSYVGVVVPGGLLSPEQARGLAAIADEYGNGELRLTTWQNVIIPDLKDTQIHRVKEALKGVGLEWSASKLQSGLVACTGSAGCKFALADTKRHASEILRELEARVKLDTPISVRLSGCHHGCAQQLTADIGLLASMGESQAGERGCYDVSIGGREGPNAVMARPFAQRVNGAELPGLLAELIEAFAEGRLPDESFHEFVGRVPPAELRRGSKRRARTEGSAARP